MLSIDCRYEILAMVDASLRGASTSRILPFDRSVIQKAMFK
jgi:hypothetical protein